MPNNEELVSFNVTEKTPRFRFLASLSDGTTVVEDKIKGQPHAWKRLKRYLDVNPDLSITCLRLQSSDSGVTQTLPSNQDGYFYAMRHAATYPSNIQQKFIGIGYFDGVTVVIKWYKFPSFLMGKTEKRTEAQAGILLIKKIVE